MTNLVRTFTAVVNDGASKHFTGKHDWSRDAIRHNMKWFPNLELVKETSDLYLQMSIAAMKVYGWEIVRNWGFGTLSNYIAMRYFLDMPGDSMIWIEADMIRNPSVPMLDVRGVCETNVWDNPNHTPNPYEIHKRRFCEAFMYKSPRPYRHFMSSWFHLEREQVQTIVEGLHVIGLDLLKPSAWELIRQTELEIGVKDFRFVCDMLIELSWMSQGWEFGNVFDQLGWVSYTDDCFLKPIIHFDGPHKPKISSYIKAHELAIKESFRTVVTNFDLYPAW